MNARTFMLLVFIGLGSCQDEKLKKPASVIISDQKTQASYFAGLMSVLGEKDSLVNQHDSSAFLILPLLSSCPSCRTKTIKSIVKYQQDLPANHIVILSAKISRKTMSSYFRDEGIEIPAVNRILLDTANVAGEHGLYDAKPTIYYATGKLVYKRVASTPSTIVGDLEEYFKELK